MRSEKCYVGIEAEGPYREKRFLFVPGHTSPEEFKAAYGKVAIQGVYYGAGSDSPLRKDTMEYMEEMLKGFIWTIEFTDTLNERYVLDFGEGILYKKIEHPLFIIWHKVSKKLHYTWCEDPRFKTDKEVE